MVKKHDFNICIKAQMNFAIIFREFQNLSGANVTKRGTECVL